MSVGHRQTESRDAAQGFPPAAAGSALAAEAREDTAPAAGAVLDNLQLASLALNLDASLRVHGRAQFFSWTQGLLQSLVKHEVLICALRGARSRTFHVESYSAAVPDAAIFSEAFQRDSCAASHLLNAWEERRFRPVVREARGAPFAGGSLVRELERVGATLLFAHGTHDADAQVASFFTFACRSGTDESRQGYFVQLVVPFLHSAWMRAQVSATAERNGHAPAAASALTPREQEILRWICLGKSNGEIGAILSISPLTVKNHVQKLLRRLNVVNRAQAVAKALELRALDP
jgi:transcriptional regulator EpsA